MSFLLQATYEQIYLKDIFSESAIFAVYVIWKRQGTDIENDGQKKFKKGDYKDAIHLSKDNRREKISCKRSDRY